MKAFKLSRGGLQDRFLKSRAKVQIFGGGFANGKTSAACIKALQLAQQYPGSNGLIARETRPKLADTIMKEFVKWCPPEWIKSFPRGQNSSNTCTLVNGTEINFRYIQQQKKGENESTSNLLSATYDWIIVDQMEDPGITEKDFDDLLGRLRGSTRYEGDDPSMPRDGPRWFIITCNPTRNWLYRTLVAPLQAYQASKQRRLDAQVRGDDFIPELRIPDNLLCVRDRDTGKPKLDDDGEPELLIDLHEGATYENAQNLGEDFIITLESRYQGSMKERFLMGRWAAYSGLIYGQYDEDIHSISEHEIEDYYWYLVQKSTLINWLEGYDYGMAVPSCYGAAFVDPHGNVILVDGFYQEEMLVKDQADAIKMIREKWGISYRNQPFADPQIFRRSPGNRDTVGQTVAGMFHDEGINMQRGNNAIVSGIQKIQAHLNLYKMHRNPFTGEYGAPHFYHSSSLDWMITEFNEYVWATDAKGDLQDDKPVDKDDHAMDMTKYLTSLRPKPSIVPVPQVGLPRYYTQWSEAPDEKPDPRSHRH